MQKIALWAVPRAVGTAFERVFVERDDTTVAHELFMPCYYYSASRRSSRYDGSVEPLPEHDFEHVVEQFNLLSGRSPVLLMKEIAYHAEGLLGNAFWASLRHTFILRDPRVSIPSLYKLMPDLTLTEAGFPGLAEVFKLATEELDQSPVVVNGDVFRSHPQRILEQYCELVGIPYEDTTTWRSDRVVPEWQKWESWHKDALTSEKIFAPPARDASSVDDLPQRIQDIIEQSLPFYEAVNCHALG